MTRKITLVDVIREALDNRLADVHTAIPARVERYDAAKQRVDAKPLIKASYTDETGASVVESLPVVAGVPVQFPGGGGFRVTFPIAVGDTGLLVFTEASIDKWLSQGGEVDPLDYHRHHLSDGVFIPGVRPFSAPLASAPTDRASLGKDGGLTVDVTASDIRLGGDAATEAAALGNALQTFIGHLADGPGLSLLAWVTQVTTYINSIAPGTLTPPPNAPTLASSTVKLKP